VNHLAVLVAAGLLLPVACGGAVKPQSTKPARSPGLPSTCAAKTSGHRAFVVVTHMNGSNRLSCGDFTTDTITGPGLLQASSIPFKTAARSYGLAICEVDGEPTDAPGCILPGAPYWSIWTGSPATGWEFAKVSIGKLALHDGESLGLHYVSQGGTPSPPAAAPVKLGG
jgi:hypothetical protein